jgi:hypothetical protein
MKLNSRWVQGGLVVIGLIIVLTVGALLLETNPPVKQEPAWDNPQTRALAQRACYDCHSNETVWPVYAKLPVSSWLVVFDTVRGRRELNFSEWSSSGRRRGNEAGEQINRGEMPPAIYTTMHPNAILTTAEKQQLITGLQNSLK